jgi:GAF domain-containing protein/anti-sigma regulatory factor (Ser/Thr protein kinase)
MKLRFRARSPQRLTFALAATLLGPLIATAIGLAAGLEGRAGSAGLFLVASLVSTIVGGVVFGLATGVLSFVAYVYYFVEPAHSFVASGSDYAAVAAFVGGVVLAVLLQRALFAQATASATAARMERLQRLAALLSAAATPGQIASILVSEGAAALGATAGWVSVLSDEGGDLERISSLGYADTFVAEHRVIPLAGSHVAAEVARTGRPFWLATTSGERRAEFRSAYAATGAEALALLPLRTTTDAPLGFMALRFPGPRMFTAADRDLLEGFARQAAEALQRSRLFESERQVLRIALRLQSLTAALSAAVERSEITSVMVSQTLEAFEASACDLYVVADGQLRLASHVGAPNPRTEPPVEVLQATRTGRIASAQHRELSSMTVPLAIGTRVFGALHVRTAAPRVFDLADSKFAEAIAAPCAQALERAELHQRERHARRTAQVATERLLRLQAMTASLATAITVGDVTEVAVTEGAKAIGADAAAVHLVIEDEEALVIVAATGYPDDVPAAAQRVSMEEPLAAVDAVRRTKVLWFPSRASLERRFPAEAETTQPWEATGLVPLLGREGPLGLLTLRFREPRPRRREDRALLATIGRQCGQAIERARLYEHERDAREFEGRLQEVTSAISGISGAEAIGDRVAAQLATLFDAWAAVVALRDSEGVLRPLATRNRTSTAGLVDELSSSLPLAEATRAGQIVVSDAGPRLVVGVPLIATGRTIGALGIELQRSDALVEEELSLLRVIGGHVAEAIERARLYDDEQAARAAAQRANERLRALEAVAQVGLAARSLDELIENLLPLVRDLFGADRAELLLVEAERQELRMRAAVGLDEETIARVRMPIGRGIAGRIADTGQGVRIDDVLAAEPVSDYLRRFGGSLLGVPLRVDGRVTGVLHVTSDRRAAFEDRDLRLLTVAGDRFAIALERMLLYEREHQTAVTLQRGMLPERMPELRELTLAGRYVPGSTGVRVGGDWYDAIELRRGHVGIVVGDVVGKGVLAAAAMAQLRNALRVYATEGLKPSTVLGRLNRLVDTTGPAFATVLYAVVDTTRKTCRYASAGHPPPLIVRANGGAEFLEGGRSIPIGVLGDVEYSQDLVRLETGDVIVLYTDGLVERRGSALDDGLEQLRLAASEGPREPDALLDHIVDVLLGDEPSTDDVAVVALAMTGQPAELAQSFPAEPAALADMRSSLRDWLARCQVAQRVAEDIVLASSEACANAVEHAEHPTRTVFDLRAQKVGDEIVVSVRDYGRWREPRVGESDRGFGLTLIENMVDTVEITRLAGGTVVQLRRGATTPSISYEA